jgi:hypothetical protein
MNEATATQLRLLREIRSAFDAADVRWWLFGGWAMDAHTGEVTRDHADIEAFIWRDDTTRARDALTSAGFLAWPSLHPDEAAPFTKDGQEVGCWFLTRNDAGDVITPGRGADWPWAAGAFDAPPGVIDDLELPVMSLEGLLDLKTNFAQHPHGAPLREKDVADIELLRALLAARDHDPEQPG